MDKDKIGRFIAFCRKEKGLTQASLAEKLFVTDRAVSRWETGKSMPDSSIMLELCNILGINVNELLTGEKIEKTNYNKQAEKNLLNLKQEKERINKLWLKAGIVLLTFAIILFIPIYVFANIIGLHLYFGWQEVYLNNLVSIKVPDDWKKGEKNGLIYFTDSDSDNEVVFFQSRKDAEYEYGEPIVIDESKGEKNIVSNNFKNLISVSSTVNSLGTVYGETIVAFDNKAYVEKYVDFCYGEYLFYSCGNEIDEDILRKIADSIDRE